jgi:hypothetical protein
MRPCLAKIGGLPDRRAEPFIASAGVNGGRCRIGDDMIDRPCIAERAAKLPHAPRGIALENEGAFFGAYEEKDFFRHMNLPVFPLLSLG